MNIEYRIRDCVVVQNNIGAVRFFDSLTLPGGSAAVVPSDANAVVLEWPAVDIADLPMGSALYLGCPLLGSTRIVQEAIPPVSDIVVGFYVKAVGSDSAIGSLIYYEASPTTYGLIRMQGTWATQTTTFPGVEGSLCTWTTVRTSTGGGDIAIVRTATAGVLERGPLGEGRLLPSITTSSFRTNGSLFIRFDESTQVVLQMYAARTTGAAGDVTINPRLFANIWWGGSP